MGRAAGSDGGNVPALRRAVRRGRKRACGEAWAARAGRRPAPTGGFETGELLASYRSRSVAGDQWLAPETNRKASSIVFTPAFDPSELVSIFEY